MSKNLIIIWATVVVVVVVGGIWWWSLSYTNSNTTSGGPYNQQNASTTANTNTQTGVIVSPSDVSDAALDQDLSSIDNQLNGLSSDQKNVDQGLAQ